MRLGGRRPSALRYSQMAVKNGDERRSQLPLHVVKRQANLWPGFCTARNRARITQIMNLNLLSPQLQEALLFLPPVETGRDSVTLRGLQAVCLEVDWGRQTLSR